MNKSALIKIAGILIGSFAVITVATFFLYPYINEEKYEQIQAEREQQMPPDDLERSSDPDLSATYRPDAIPAGENEAASDSVFSQVGGPEMMKIDSLFAVNDSLTQQLDSIKNSLNNLENALRASGAEESQLDKVKRGAENVDILAASDVPKEEFAERVKSLLNLDEEDLTPIANQMTQHELVKIYSSSGNIQREKLLRSLSPERATKLMQEIML
ncbi:hypothetical protein [Rhodohalobacter sp. 8-1]|uniref:hypothetical protein n=1 Tax=Rhodohalobacter sp. 8-1 TaxID=3131972 RepID=UPI0030EE6E00